GMAGHQFDPAVVAALLPPRGRPGHRPRPADRAGRVILALPVALGLVLGLAFGGDPRLLTTLKLRFVGLFYAAIGLQLVAFPLAFLPWRVSDGIGRALWLASYAVLCGAAVLNLQITGVPIV